MTLATTASTSGPYNCNGATTAFSYAWKILDDDEIEVTLISSAGVRTTLTKTTHYTVSGVGSAGGGSVTTVSTYAAGYQIYLRRKPPLTQTSEFQNQGSYSASSHEEAFDKLAMQQQYVRDEAERGVKVPKGEAGLTIPDAAARASMVMSFDSAGDPAVDRTYAQFVSDAADEVGAATLADIAAAEDAILHPGTGTLPVAEAAALAAIGAAEDAILTPGTGTLPVAEAAALAAIGAAEDAILTPVTGTLAVAEAAAIAAVTAEGDTQDARVTAEGSTQVALVAATPGSDQYASTANAVSNGVWSVAITAGGSGGTTGTYYWTTTGGGGSNAAGYLTVAGGAITAVGVTNRGYGYTSAPTIVIAGTHNVTGHTLTPSTSQNQTAGSYFIVKATNGFEVYTVTSGTTTSLVETYPTYTAASTAIMASFQAVNPGLSLSLSQLLNTYKYTEGSGSVSPSAYRTISFTSGTSYTVTGISKKGERQFVNVYCGAGALFDVTFDLTDGTIARLGTSNTATITDLGRGWYLWTATRVATATTSDNLQVRMGTGSNTFTYTGDGSSGMYVPWVSLTVTGSTTELLSTYDLSNSYWTKSAGCSFVAEVLTGTSTGAQLDGFAKVIDGGTPAKLTEASGASLSPSLYRSRTCTSGKVYRFTAVVRGSTRTRLNIYDPGAPTYDVTFDLSTGSVAGTGGVITRRGVDEWLIEVTGTAASTGASITQLRIYQSTGGHPYTGDGTSGLYVLSVAEYEDGVLLFQHEAPTLVDSTWTKQNLTVALDAAAPFAGIAARAAASEATASTLTARTSVLIAGTPAKLTEASGASVSPSLYRLVSTVNGSDYKYSIVARAQERARLNVYLAIGATVVFDHTCDLSGGTASGTGVTISPRGGDEYTITGTVTAGATGTGNLQLRVYPTSGGHPYAGDGTSGLSILSVRLFKDGVEQFNNAASDLVSATWTKQSLTVALTPSALFRALPDRIDTLETASTGFSSFVGKKIAVVGTSLVAQGLLTAALAGQTGATVQTLGYSGGALGVDARGSPHYGSGQVTALLPSIDVASNIIILDMLVNDVATSDVPLGVVTDTTTATYCGALANFFTYCKANYPSASVCVVVQTAADTTVSPSDYTHGHANANGDYLEDFQNATRRMCDYYGRPYIDPNRYGIGFQDAAENTSDDLHWDDDGAARVAKIYVKEMRDLTETGWGA